MSDYLLNQALTDIDDRYLNMVDQTVKEIRNMKTIRITRKQVRTLLLVAVLIVLLSVTAYAISSLHAARQQELKAELQIEENHVTGYTEYAENPQPTGTAQNADPVPQIQLLSSIQQGDFQTVYLSVSPVSEELAHSFFFENMVTGFAYIASNEEITDEDWEKGYDQGGPGKGIATPVPYINGHEAEHMVEKRSQSGLPDENGEQTWVTYQVVDPDWYKPLLMEHSYDPETQSLMLMINILRDQVDLSRQVYLSVRCLDYRSLWTDEDTSVEETYQPVYLKDYGTVVLEASDTDFISLNLTEPIHLINPENGGNLEILDIRLSATALEWKLTFDDVDLVYNLPKDDETAFHEGFEKQLQWIRFEDQILSGAYLTFADGRTFELHSTASAPCENGVVTLTSVWDSTIDISSVKSITVMGTEHLFP